jgi:galactonate dehydratase
MKRRAFLQASALIPGAALPQLAKAENGPWEAKITRIRFYQNPRSRPIFNQSMHVITIETDVGITGIGEGGSKDTIEQCGGLLIGENPFQIEHLWQLLYRGYFYPPGREKLHAIGALGH